MPFSVEQSTDTWLHARKEVCKASALNHPAGGMMNSATAHLTGVVLETEPIEADVEETWLIDGVEPPDIEPDDPEALRRLDDATSRFLSLESKLYEQLYEQCQILLLIRSTKLFRAARFNSFVEFAEKRLRIDGRRAEKMSEYARNFTRDQFVKIGPSLADVGLQLLSATPEDDGPGDLFTMTLRYGPGAGKPFVNATIREVREEIRTLRDSATAVAHVVPEGLTETTKYLAQQVTRAKFKLKNFRSKNAVTTGLVIEFPDASRETLFSTLAHIMAALGPVVRNGE